MSQPGAQQTDSSFTPQTESPQQLPAVIPEVGEAPLPPQSDHVPPHFRYDPDQDAYDVNLSHLSSADYNALEAQFYRLAPEPTSTTSTTTTTTATNNNTAVPSSSSSSGATAGGVTSNTSSSFAGSPSPTSSLAINGSQPTPPTNSMTPWSLNQHPLGNWPTMTVVGAQGSTSPQIIVVQPLVFVVGSDGSSVPRNQSPQQSQVLPPPPPYVTASGTSPTSPTGSAGQPQVTVRLAPPPVYRQGVQNTTQFAPPTAPPPLGAELRGMSVSQQQQQQTPAEQQQPQSTDAKTVSSETKEPNRRVSPEGSPRRLFIGQVPVTRTDDGTIATDRIATHRMLLLLCQFVKHKFCPFEGDVWFADPMYEGTGCVRPQVASQAMYPFTHVLPCRVIVSQDFSADREMTIFQEPLTSEAVRRLRDSKTHLVIVFQDQHTISERQQLRSRTGKKGNWGNSKKNNPPGLE